MAAKRRDKAYIWASWITKLMSGEAHCTWAVWFKSNFSGYQKVPTDFNLAKWTAEHDRLVKSRARELSDAGCAVRVEDQNSFKVEGKNGAILSGKADIVAIYKDHALIVDVKTGRPRNADMFQVMMYMLFLPHVYPDLRGLTIAGEVCYKDDRVKISADEVGPELRSLVAGVIGDVTSDLEPVRVPSWGECRYCDITSTDCPERVSKEPGVGGTDVF